MPILIIGEVPEVLQKGTAILRQEGIVVEIAENSDYARFRWQNWDYDLIIVDEAPGLDVSWLDSPELQQRNSETPVLRLVSDEIAEAASTQGETQSQTTAQTRQVMVKSFTGSDLIGRVRAMIRQPQAADAQSIVIGPLVIDRVQQTVTINRNDVPLTSKEFCLLEFLAIHRGTLVRRTEIYDHLFEYADPTLSNLLDVYVCNIRRKLGEKIITTRRGAGYLIEG